MSMRTERLIPSSARYPLAVAKLCETALFSDDVEAVLHAGIEIVAEELSLDHVLVMDCVAQGTKLRVRSVSNSLKAYQGRLISELISVENENNFAWHRETIVNDIREAQEPSLLRRFLDQEGLASGFAVPITESGVLIGFLFAASRVAWAFNHAVVEYLRATVRVLSLAMERAGLRKSQEANIENLIQAKQEWQAIVDALPQMVCLLDEEGRVVRANRTLELWPLGTIKTVKGATVHNLLHPMCDQTDCQLKKGFERAWAGFSSGQPSNWELYDTVLGRDIRFVLRKGARILSLPNELNGSYAVLVAEDITARNYEESILESFNQELRHVLREDAQKVTAVNVNLKNELGNYTYNKHGLIASRKKYRALLENTLTGVCITQDGEIVFCNKHFAQIFGYSKQELDGMDITRLLVNADPLKKTPSELNRPHTKVSSQTIVDIPCITKGGRPIWIRQSVNQIQLNNKLVTILNVIEITQQKSTEDSLRKSEGELRQLSKQLLQIQENERKRIASDLHDGIGQSLSAVKFGLENMLRELSDSLHRRSLLKLEAVVSKIRDMIEEVRKISMDLRPSIIDDLGIVATINWFCREFQLVHPALVVIKDLDIQESAVESTLKVVIFRILQEAFNNIANHADASEVYVSLKSLESKIELRVKDDGRGFVIDDKQKTLNGFGLNSMNERAKLSGGCLQVHSVLGNGTCVEAKWPGKRMVND